MYVYIHAYVYILKANDILKLPPSFFKTQIVFLNIQPQSYFPSFHLQVNIIRKWYLWTTVADGFKKQLQCTWYLPRKF